MNQALYSNTALKYITKNHPDFLKTINFKDDQSFDCSIKSSNGNRFLWIATYNSELTIGFENAEGECDWHFHIDTSGGKCQTEELEKMSIALEEIINNQHVFILNGNQYIPIDNDEYERLNNTGNTVFFKWSEI